MTYLNPIEFRIVHKIVNRALAKGYHVSVSDGEEYTVRHSRNYDAIMDAVGTTDETTLRIRDEAKAHVGFVYLVHGNLEDVVSDASDNAIMDELTAWL